MNIYLDSYEGVSNAFNLGQTKRVYSERHNDGDYGKAKQLAEALETEYVQIGWWENVDVTDHDIHKWLKKQPFIQQIGQETFKFAKNCGLTLDIIKDMIERQFFTAISEVKKEIRLHKHQKEFVAKAQANYLEFLLFAKCRAGKSVMTLSHIVDRNLKVTLVVSRYTSPKQSWRDDSKNFSNFDNIVFIDFQGNKNYKKEIDYWMNTDKQIVVFDTVQGAIKKEFEHNVDLLVYDEAHEGYNTDQFNKLREMTKCSILYVTGTAYKMLWDFVDSQRYIYSYYEEQLDKKIGLNNRPSMKVILAKYDSAQYQSIFGDDADAMKNLFQVDDEGNFLHPSLVQDFVSYYFGTQRHLRPQDRLLKDSTHLYITLPSVAACHAFEKYLQGTRFAPLVVTGETHTDADDINKHIAENPNGSIILTRTANVLGVTAKEVDTIINCAEGSSIEFWTQFAFRGGSGDHDWIVIDFCPQRCLESLRQTFIAACDTSPKVSKYDFTDFISIVEWSKGFETLSVERVNEILAADVGNAIRLVSGIVTSLNFDKLRDLEFNLNLKATNSNLAKSIQVNDNGANGKSNKKQITKLERSKKDEIIQKVDTIQAILERIPLVLFYSINSGEIVNTIDSVLKSSHYKPVTLDDENIIEMALQCDIINRKSLSTRISKAYVDIQHAIQKDKILALYELSESTQTQRSIPVELFEQMLGV